MIKIKKIDKCWWCVCVCSVTQSCLTLCSSMSYSPPGSSAHGIFQARALEWGVIPTPRDLPSPGTEPSPPASTGRPFATSAPRAARGLLRVWTAWDTVHSWWGWQPGTLCSPGGGDSLGHCALLVGVTAWDTVGVKRRSRFGSQSGSSSKG